MFQSSSYWRMAGKNTVWVSRAPSGLSFNPHHTGEWLERPHLADAPVHRPQGFNPHHTGEWLGSSLAFVPSAKKALVSILIILANGWKVRGGEAVLVWGLAVSILIILANGWKVDKNAYYESLTPAFQSSSYWRMAGKYCWISF